MGLLIAVACAAMLTVDVKVEKVDYKGWKDCTRVSNGTVEFVVVPQIGRVMRYGYVDGANVLWENDPLAGQTFGPDPQTWRNYGGDKLWISPQSLWTWPPDPLVDGQPWKLEPIANGVQMTSPVGGKIKVRMLREITLEAGSTEVTFSNSMQNLADRRELGLWQVTQVDAPDTVTMPLEITTQQPKGWFGFGRESLNPKYHSIENQMLVLHRNPSDNRKFGSCGIKGVLDATRGSLLFTSESKVFRGAKYADTGSAQVVNLSADPYSYAELGHQSPLARMERNEIAMQTVKWKLSKG